GTLAEDGGLFVRKEHAINYLESHDDNTLGDFVRMVTGSVTYGEPVRRADASTTTATRRTTRRTTSTTATPISTATWSTTTPASWRSGARTPLSAARPARPSRFWRQAAIAPSPTRSRRPTAAASSSRSTATPPSGSRSSCRRDGGRSSPTRGRRARPARSGRALVPATSALILRQKQYRER